VAPALVTSRGVRIASLLVIAACSSRTAPVGVEPSAAQRSQALFVEVSRVLTHARCVNCHPPDATPRQGDLHAFHDPPVDRGTADRGVVGMQCQTCHQDRNLELARVPGATGWRLAPLTMAWLGKSPAQICAQISDPARNGGRSLAQVHDHLAHDELVAWGWSPGANRVPVPGTQAQLAALFQSWIDSGAVCPEGGTLPALPVGGRSPGENKK
jgi:hypothetical protein